MFSVPNWAQFLPPTFSWKLFCVYFLPNPFLYPSVFLFLVSLLRYYLNPFPSKAAPISSSVTKVVNFSLLLRHRDGKGAWEWRWYKENFTLQGFLFLKRPWIGENTGPVIISFKRSYLHSYNPYIQPLCQQQWQGQEVEISFSVWLSCFLTHK